MKIGEQGMELDDLNLGRMRRVDVGSEPDQFDIREISYEF